MKRSKPPFCAQLLPSPLSPNATPPALDKTSTHGQQRERPPPPLFSPASPFSAALLSFLLLLLLLSLRPSPLPPPFFAFAPRSPQSDPPPFATIGQTVVSLRRPTFNFSNGAKGRTNLFRVWLQRIAFFPPLQPKNTPLDFQTEHNPQPASYKG